MSDEFYKKKHGGLRYTPDEAAHDIAIGWLRLAATHRTSDIDNYVTTGQKARIKKIRQAIGRLHDRLLEESGLDGSPLGLE